MNAPRQGSFAALLALSFLLHAALQVQSMDHQLAVTRQAQGELLTQQLSFDTINPLMQRDRVALALLVNRLAQRPDVNLLRVLDSNHTLLATGGVAPTRTGQVFTAPVVVDGRQIGRTELTLSEPSRGEIIRMFWLPLLLSLLLHAGLWLAYRMLARPYHLMFEMDDLAQPPQPVPAPEHHAPAPAPAALTAHPAEAVAPDLVVQLVFADPKSLLPTLSPGLAQPYLSLNQTLLEQALVQLQTAHPGVKFEVMQPFGLGGALVALRSALQADAVQAAIELASLMQAINEVVCRQHRSKKRFALPYRIAVAQAQGRRSAQWQAEHLIEQMPAEAIWLHVDEPLLAELVRHLPLQPLPHPLTAQMREAMAVTGLPESSAQWVTRARKRILGLETTPVTE